MPLKENKPGSRGFTEIVRKQRFSEATPTACLLRRGKGASIARVRQNHVFAQKRKTTAGARKSTPGSPKPQRGHAKQGARQGGTEPGPPASERRTQDHWATSPAAGPRRARGPRAGKRPRPRKRASLARANFGPELGFEQRSRFRSSQGTRRT